jgi:type IV pilus assembly protein PilV
LAEVFAAILVIAVGLVGIAALYSDGLRTTYETSPQAQAAELAESIAKRIEANPTGRIGYISAIGVVCDAPRPAKLAEDIAAREAACWEDEVERTLPSGLGSISRDQSTTPHTYIVAVSWSSEETGAASYVIRVQPKS